MFQPVIAGANEPRVSALAHLIVNAIADYPYGTRIIFENPQSARGRAAILQAKQRLLHEHSKLLVNEKDKGYRIAQPNEHVREAKRLESHGRRRYRRSLDVIVYAEEAKLTPQERQQNQEQGLRLRLLLAIHKNIGKATLSGSGASTALVIPSGRDLARLLQEPAADAVDPHAASTGKPTTRA